MNKIIILLFISINCIGQTHIQNGVNAGTNSERINSNFDTIYWRTQSRSIYEFSDLATAISYCLDNYIPNLILVNDTFVISSSIIINDLNKNKQLSIWGNGAVLDYSGAPANMQALSFTSEATDTFNITHIEEGRDWIVLSGLSNINQGDVLEIYSTELWGFRSEYTKGELIEVSNVSNDTIWLTNFIHDDYNLDSTVCINKNMGSISIYDLSIISNANTVYSSIQFNSLRNSKIENCKFYNSGASTLSYSCCFNSEVSGNSLYTSSGEQFKVSSSSFINVYRNQFGRSGSHAFTIGGWYPNRYINFELNRVIQTNAGATQTTIDIHGNAEFVTIKNNYGFGGGYSRCRNIEIIDNIFIPRFGFQSWSVNISEFNSIGNNYNPADYIIFDNNKWLTSGQNDGVSYCIDFNSFAQYDTVDLIAIRNNHFDNFTSGCIRFNTNTNSQHNVNVLEISDNYFNSDNNAHPIMIRAKHRINSIIINNNKSYTPNSAFFRYETDVISDLVKLSNNDLYSNGLTVFIGDTAQIELMRITDNNIIGSGTYSSEYDRLFRYGNCINYNCDTLIIHE